MTLSEQESLRRTTSMRIAASRLHCTKASVASSVLLRQRGQADSSSVRRSHRLRLAERRRAREELASSSPILAVLGNQRSSLAPIGERILAEAGVVSRRRQPVIDDLGFAGRRLLRSSVAHAWAWVSRVKASSRRRSTSAQLIRWPPTVERRVALLHYAPIRATGGEPEEIFPFLGAAGSRAARAISGQHRLHGHAHRDPRGRTRVGTTVQHLDALLRGSWLRDADPDRRAP